ncbi:MAG: SDR family NAD(P)-dependent oxidoreductase, partial [Propionibacteriaceae bacterium]|nr:SDR family NAD(P)-dependent oxidoreductase [Propionibacteriaceae bacterium]
MEKRTVIVTGGNSGLGYQCARNIAATGKNYTVVIACRHPEKSVAAVESLRRETGNDNIHWLPLDLSSFDSVRHFVDEFKAGSFPPLYGLVCNAGITYLNLFLSHDGLEVTFQTCYLAHWLLTHLLLNQMVDHGRIVCVTSDMHRVPFGHSRPKFTDINELAYTKRTGPTFWFYSRAKFCIVLGVYEMARRLAAETHTGITVNVYHPGVMAETNIWPTHKSRLLGFFQGLGVRIFGCLVLQGSTAVRSGKVLAGFITKFKYEGATGKYYFPEGNLYPSARYTYDRQAADKL